jgi:hypothetical protein
VCQFAYQQFWIDKRSSLKTESSKLIDIHPDAAARMKQLFKVLCQIEDLATYTPSSVGECDEWAEGNRESYCGKPLFNALYGTCTVTLNELENVLKARNQAGQIKQADGFKEVGSRKRHSTEETALTPKKTTVTSPAAKVAKSNFYAPFRTSHMDTDAPVTESNSTETAAGRPQ